MESNWAADHLQVIRTLMERSALYRRALAPIMTYNGVIGVAAGLGGWAAKIDTNRGFVAYWSCVGLAALGGSFFLVRRQALKEAEPFWSPPTRRVAQALMPALFAGSIAGLLTLLCPSWDFLPVGSLPAFWMLIYGCALTAAGFFMHRGMKLLGWLFILAGCTVMAIHCPALTNIPAINGHCLMGAIFGGLHLAYGVYLYFTEQRRNEA
ncbi:MAG TPA: hypothetical protein VKY92_27670 [Verrucomicrobiae bacterium]|nr:hypothetical protein [Verrucomicrobiae bacterium]